MHRNHSAFYLQVEFPGKCLGHISNDDWMEGNSHNLGECSNDSILLACYINVNRMDEFNQSIYTVVTMYTALKQVIDRSNYQ